MFKFFRLSVIGFGVLCAIAAILSLVATAFDYSYGQLITAALAEYAAFTNILISPIIDWARDEIVKYVGSFPIHDDAKHILLIIGLYMTRNLSNNFWYRPDNAILLLVPAIVFALLGAVGFGALALAAPHLAVIPPVLAFILFELTEDLHLSYSKHRPNDQTGNETFFGHYWPKAILPRVIAGIAIAAAGVVAVQIFPPNQAQAALLLLPITYLVLLTGILLWRGVAVANKARSEGRDWWKSFHESNNTRLFKLLASVFVGAALLILADWVGLKPLGI